MYLCILFDKDEFLDVELVNQSICIFNLFIVIMTDYNPESLNQCTVPPTMYQNTHLTLLMPIFEISFNQIGKSHFVILKTRESLLKEQLL